MTMLHAAIEGLKVGAPQGANLRGWAYPLTGSLCGALRVFADEALVLADRADRFDPEAAKAGVRDGWCGFELHLREEHFVLADELDVRCAVSGKSLFKIRASDLALGAVAARSAVTIEDLLVTAFEPRYVSIEPFIPVMERLESRLSPRQLLDGWRRLILGAPLDDQSWNSELSALAAKSSVSDIARLMAESRPETWRGLPSVFAHEFPCHPAFMPLKAR
jgi:hypothetical protein